MRNSAHNRLPSAGSPVWLAGGLASATTAAAVLAAPPEAAEEDEDDSHEGSLCCCRRGARLSSCGSAAGPQATGETTHKPQGASEKAEEGQTDWQAPLNIM